ncbi:SE1832 family protein [Rossellomorea sp. SC111]|uniref:SE1832 family protein n=1 Tax=Rossellomorea sp. SC111 TaxID=2968985 RepID=UPI00215AEF8B|nr:SE1832 family protein [Rossellomorea sp. SC111]MCR8847948.1 SE1832 family protein [Rossellomorea sp. SC111]
MTKEELEYKVNEVKLDYIRIQGDLEKLESFGRNTDIQQRKLDELETELSDLREQLEAIDV